MMADGVLRGDNNGFIMVGFEPTIYHSETFAAVRTTPAGGFTIMGKVDIAQPRHDRSDEACVSGSWVCNASPHIVWRFLIGEILPQGRPALGEVFELG